MRPSTGRIPRRFGFPATCIDFQVIGPFARTMRDMRLLYSVLAGPDPRDPYSERFPPPPEATTGRCLRIGWFIAIGDESATPEAAAVHALAMRTARLPRYRRRSISVLCAAFMPR
jgi:aspartyl-tRNA(Asn)/glutamyl-tRNA(Gln) amidotransferase subunit A